MKIFFDVDYTILGLDDTLRPNTKETFQKLLDDKHEIHIWSGMGERWEVIEKHDLGGFVSGVYEKPTDHFHEKLEELKVPCAAMRSPTRSGTGWGPSREVATFNS